MWMSHVTWRRQHGAWQCIIVLYKSWHTHEWVMAFIWMRHVDETCHTYECVMAHIWMSHVTYINESRHYGRRHGGWRSNGALYKSWQTIEWVMSNIWMSPDTHMNATWHTYEWVMSHIWMSHVTYRRRHGGWWSNGALFQQQVGISEYSRVSSEEGRLDCAHTSSYSLG